MKLPVKKMQNKMLTQTMTRRFLSGCVFLTGSVLLAGCAVGVDAERPAVRYADTFSNTAAQPSVTNPTQISTPLVAAEWWNSFQSPVLTQLILDATQQSPDLLIAAERVRQAELQMRIANATLFPSLNLSASSGERRSDNAANTTDSGAGSGIGSNATTTTGKRTTASSNVNLGISYEVDLWGGLAAGRRSANAGFNATTYEQDAAQLSIKAAIASGWFQWLALQERIATAQKNIAIAERVQRIVEARYNNGAATAADVAKQKTNLLTQQASLLPLELQAKQTRSALAILVGKTPQEFIPGTENLQALAIPVIAPGTPAELVTRRPDLAASEARLIAANADIAQARAALLPGITLGASVGKSSSELFSLNPATQASSWSLSLAQTVFNGGRVLNQKRLSEARRAELLLQYHKAILIALQEVDDGLARADVSQRQEQSQQEIVVQAERSLRLTEARYREGSDDLIALMDVQRSLFQAQDSLVQQRLSRLNAAVELYKALGGGWLIQP